MGSFIKSQLFAKIIDYHFITYKEQYPIVSHQIGKFLYGRKEYAKDNLFLKSYGPMASFHKVIKLLKLKSAANLH